VLKVVKDGENMDKGGTRIFTTRLPLPLAEKVDDISRRLERSKGWILQRALLDWIEREEERTRLTVEGLNEVDAGRVIDHSSVQAWANSLDSDHPLPPPTSAHENGE
jgi:predicted transcriptional regulator